MTDLYNGELLQQMAQMPEAEDKRVKALSFALARGKQWAMDFAVKSQTQAGIDKLDYEMLDILAVETNTQYYLENMPWEMKRAVLKGVLKWKTLAGTAGAVREVVETIFGNGSLHEWFEYGGNPGYFKVDIGTMLTEDNVAWFMRVVSQVKPARAHLEAVTCILEGDIDGDELVPGHVITEYGETKISSKVTYTGALDFSGMESFLLGLFLSFRMPFWGENLLDGSWVLDGQRALDGMDRGLPRMGCDVHSRVRTDVEVGTLVIETFSAGFFLLDGSVLLDGSRRLNSFYQREVYG